MNTSVNDPERSQSVLIISSPFYISIIIKISRSYQKVLGTKLKHKKAIYYYKRL